MDDEERNRWPSAAPDHPCNSSRSPASTATTSGSWSAPFGSAGRSADRRRRGSRVTAPATTASTRARTPKRGLPRRHRSLRRPPGQAPSLRRRRSMGRPMWRRPRAVPRSSSSRSVDRGTCSRIVICAVCRCGYIRSVPAGQPPWGCGCGTAWPKTTRTHPWQMGEPQSVASQNSQQSIGLPHPEQDWTTSARSVITPRLPRRSLRRCEAPQRPGSRRRGAAARPAGRRRW
jgi:hypothetical protein